MRTHARPRPTPPGEPFLGYLVKVTSDADRLRLAALADRGPALHQILLAPGRTVTVSIAGAAALYASAEAAGREPGLAFPLRFIPIRPQGGRALPFEAVALGAPEILYLVHEGFFGAARCREAAIAAVQACGALPVPGLALPPVWRRAERGEAERHVDALIEGEPWLRVSAAAEPRRPA